MWKTYFLKMRNVFMDMGFLFGDIQNLVSMSV